MWFRTLFDSMKHRRSGSPVRRTPRRPAASRLLVEALEDRCLPSFLAPISYAAGSYPVATVAADFNNDTVLDLAVANYSSSDVSVLLGNADGTFQPAQNSATGLYPQSLAVGDFNADGKLDLATANAGDVSVLLGNGNGTFQAPTDIGIGSDPASVAVADFNADGKLDLGVTSNIDVFDGCDEYGQCYDHYQGDASVLLGDGAGSFWAPITTSLGYGIHSSAAVADFNGDLKQDFASANNDYATVTVLLGTGTGTFGDATNFGTGPYPLSVAAGDVNGDGKLDLVTANANGATLSVLLGTGLGSFGAAQSYTAGSVPLSLAMADFNGDGKIDLVTANGDSGTVSVLLGTGAGAFKPPVNVATAAGLVGVTVGDFNGDGRPDAASAAGTSIVSVLLNDGIWPALAAPSITINDVTVTEGNIGTVNATFTVSLSAAYGQTVSIRYATADDSATAGADYQAASGTLTFNPGGPLTQTITVQVIGDRLPEYYEFFYVRLTDPTNAFVADGTGVGTILDDEPTFSFAGNVSGVEGNTGTTPFTFTVTLSAVYDAPVTVDYATADNSATLAGGDYQATAGTVTFAAGQTSGTITVLVNGDRLVESDEYFFVVLSNPTSAHLGSSLALGTIVDDEPRVSIGSASGLEGNVGTTPFTFTITLSAAYDAPVTVDFATADHSATLAGGDYQAASGTVIFAAGQTSQNITVLVNGDRLGDPNEYFFVNLSNPNYGAIANSQGRGTILDDEPYMRIDNVRMNEGNSGTAPSVFTVTLSTAYDLPVTVNFTTVNGSATAGSDYQAASGTLTIAAGQTSGTINVLVNGDRLGEPNETFLVNLSNLNYGVLPYSQGLGTIVDDEPRISISDVTKAEGRKGQTTLFTFTVTLSTAYDQTVTMSYQTVNGTATTSDSDYVAKTGTLTFAPGETTKTITIVVNGDNKKEANETFYVDLFGNSSDSFFTKNRGLGTILNDNP